MNTQSIPEEYRKTVLPSGIRIVSEHIPSVRSLSIGVWIDVGSRDEHANENGISHFVEHAVFKGTTKRRPHHIAQYLEAVGGFLNAFTTKDSTCYYARVLDRHLDRAVEILADLVLHPAFAPRDIEKEKQVIFEEMKSAEDDPEDIINDYLDELLFGSHPLAQPVIGTREVIAGLNPQVLRGFIGRHYTAEKIVIAASGAVNHDHLVRLCEEKFAAVGKGTRPLRRKPRARKPRNMTLTKPSQQSHLMMGVIVPGLKDKEYYSLNVLNTILGDGMSSRLFQKVREKHGYSYNVYSALSSFEDTGVFCIYADAENGAIYRAQDSIIKVLDNLRKLPVSRRELQRAKEQVIGGIVIGLESMDNRMQRIGRDELALGCEIPVNEMIRSLTDLTPDDIYATAQTVCNPANYSTVLILPSETDEQD